MELESFKIPIAQGKMINNSFCWYDTVEPFYPQTVIMRSHGFPFAISDISLAKLWTDSGTYNDRKLKQKNEKSFLLVWLHRQSHCGAG